MLTTKTGKDGHLCYASYGADTWIVTDYGVADEVRTTTTESGDDTYLGDCDWVAWTIVDTAPDPDVTLNLVEPVYSVPLRPLRKPSDRAQDDPKPAGLIETQYNPSERGCESLQSLEYALYSNQIREVLSDLTSVDGEEIRQSLRVSWWLKCCRDESTGRRQVNPGQWVWREAVKQVQRRKGELTVGNPTESQVESAMELIEQRRTELREQNYLNEIRTQRIADGLATIPQRVKRPVSV